MVRISAQPAARFFNAHPPREDRRRPEPPVGGSKKRHADKPVPYQVAQLTQSLDELPKALVGKRGEVPEPEGREEPGGVLDGKSLSALAENQKDNQNRG